MHDHNLLLPKLFAHNQMYENKNMTILACFAPVFALLTFVEIGIP